MRADTLSIKCDTDLITVQDTLYEHSRNNKSFTGLLELINNKIVIVTAIHNIKANKGAYTKGIDGKTIAEFLHMEYEMVIKLVQEGIRRYKPSPVRRIYRKKPNGKLRPIGIPTVNSYCTPPNKVLE